MAHILADRILESTVTTGTGALALAGAVTGFRRFSTVCAVADTVPYYIEAIDSLGQPTGDYEYGIGTYSGANTLTRTTVQGSSNGGAAVVFAAGSKNVGIALNAAGFGMLTGASGYQKLPTGVIIQWASSSVATGATISFPLAFPTSCDWAISGGSGNYANWVNSFNTTGAVIGHSGGGSQGIRVIAVGR